MRRDTSSRSQCRHPKKTGKTSTLAAHYNVYCAQLPCNLSNDHPCTYKVFLRMYLLETTSSPKTIAGCRFCQPTSGCISIAIGASVAVEAHYDSVHTIQKKVQMSTLTRILPGVIMERPYTFQNAPNQKSPNTKGRSITENVGTSVDSLQSISEVSFVL